MSSPYKRVQIIINPAAGKDETILNTINAAFSGSDIEWDARITHKFGDATRLTKEAVANGADLVAGYGGDGVKPIRAAAHYVLKENNAELGVYHWQAREITLEADPPQSVWIDGEEYGQTPITAKVLPKALEVVVP